MQQLCRVKHPSGVDIVFDPKWHQYRCGHTSLRSVSKLLDRYFPFDEAKILEHVSKKQQLPVEAIKKQWQRQALLGKNVHEYIECKLLGKPPPTFTLLMEKQRKQRQQAAAPAGDGAESSPISEMLHGDEGLYLPVADAAVEAVTRNYDVLAVEQVIAAPEWGIAGTIDFVAVNRQDRRKLLIGDWKTSGSVASNFRFGSFETPSEACLHHLPNGKVYRYAMQVIIYGEILKKERYMEKGFFDAALQRLLTGSTQADATDAVKSPARKDKKSARARTDKVPLLADYHKGDFELEYGIVQLSKNEEGGVIAQFKEVTESTVLPPDVNDITFSDLLRQVMRGE